MEKELAVVVGYIMFYDLLEEDRRFSNTSFFSKIDKAIELGEEFNKTYAEQEKAGWVDLDWEETLDEFVATKLK